MIVDFIDEFSKRNPNYPIKSLPQPINHERAINVFIDGFNFAIDLAYSTDNITRLAKLNKALREEDISKEEYKYFCEIFNINPN